MPAPIEKIESENLENVPVRLQKLARFMDSSIRLPGGYTIGWDAIIGFIPGIGDLLGMLVSGYIVVEGVKLGASRFVILRMILNTVIEGTIGTIPVIGDLFDLVFKSNIRNIKLLNSHNLNPVKVERKSRVSLFLMAVLGVCFCVVILWIGFSLLFKVLQWIF